MLSLAARRPRAPLATESRSTPGIDGTAARVSTRRPGQRPYQIVHS